MENKYPTPRQDYKVMVRCHTYNHSKYITDALNGFSMQKTDFPYCVLILDDASQDHEQNVIQEYLHQNFDMEKAEQYEDDLFLAYVAKHKDNSNCTFVVYLLKENHYQKGRIMMPYYQEWRTCSKYEALCEGDDYWIDPTKLKEQIDYMEQNEKCGLVYTKAKILDVDKNVFLDNIGTPYKAKKEIYISNQIVTLTACYRTTSAIKYYSEIPYEDRKKWLMGDYPLWLFIAEKYDIHFIDKVTAVYRANRGSASRPDSIEKKLRFIESTKDIQLYFASRTQKEGLERQIERNHMVSVVDTFKNYNRSWEGIKQVTVSRYLNVIEKIKYIIHLLFK